MRVEFTFDESKIKDKGYTLESVYYTIKAEFDKRGISCISDEQKLVFQDNGNKNDFSNMWIVIMKLTETQWFLDIASSCYWCEGNYKREDVLKRALESKNK